MVLEDILLAIAVGVVLLFVSLPIYQFLKGAPWRRKDPLAEAQERLRIAKLEAEVARVNREAEKIYEHLYEETLDDGRGAGGTAGAGGARVAAADDADEATLEESTEKEKKHGQG
jgi:hypothetical protein